MTGSDDLERDLATLVSRRAMLRGGALLGTGAGMGLLPFGMSPALADAVADGQWPAITALIEKYVNARKVSGMVAALGWGSAPPSYISRGKEGFTDRDPGGPSSLYRAYSMTKPVTGMAAMMLIDEGKLKLDQPLADFAPEFSKMSVAIDPGKSLDARPAEKLITIRHLLTHTSGFGYGGIGRNKVSDELKRLGVNPGIVSRLPIPGFNDGPPTPGPDEFLRRAATVPLVAEPGTKWSYSMSLDILGIVIARAAGKSGLDSFLAERLFGPARMTNSFFTVPRRVNGHLTTNYGILGSVPVPIDGPANSIYNSPPAFAFGGSGLVTSPADFDRFLSILINGGMLGRKRIMSDAAVRMGLNNLLPDGVDLSGTWISDYKFGAGGIVGTGKDEGLFGWSGAAGTVGFAQARLGLRSSLYVQYMPQSVLPILSEFPAAVGSDLKAMGKGT
jgi:CubicO group peptidase (beta-lactamase class C family)